MGNAAQFSRLSEWIGRSETREDVITAAPPPDEAWRREIRPDPVLPFRYSAATFNSHRIHYDQPYTTKVYS